MQITPVNNYKSTSYTYLNKYTPQKSDTCSSLPAKVFLSDKNYNRLQISFKGVPKTFEAAIKAPLEEKIANIIMILKQGDLLIAGNDLKRSLKLIKSSAKNLEFIIKRIFFLEDKKLKGTLAITKNSQCCNELINVNPKNITINVDEFISSKCSTVLGYNDLIQYEDFSIFIKEKPHKQFYPYVEHFAKVMDFEETSGSIIEQENMKILSKIIDSNQKNKSVSFKDIGGQDKVVEEIKREILYPIKYPEVYKNNKINHGIILYGPPGTGKTLIAQAIAGETSAKFYKLNGLELESRWVGESEENWRKLFQKAKENQPSIIFIDEFDGVAKTRAGNDTFGDKVVNQILSLMSDIEKDGDNIFVIGATNKLSMLDSAIIRSGRFGKHINIAAPDLNGIKNIFRIHTKNYVLDKRLNVDEICAKMHDMELTGADISHIINEANNNAFERSGIYDRMEKGTFLNSDLDSLTIISSDFEKAINSFKNTNKKRPIGY